MAALAVGYLDGFVISITCVTFYKRVLEISGHHGDSGRLLAGTIASSLLKGSARVGNLEAGSAVGLPGAL